MLRNADDRQTILAMQLWEVLNSQMWIIFEFVLAGNPL